MAYTETLEIVHKFLLEANRPYTIDDILSKCDEKLEKVEVQHALDKLVQSEKLTIKMFDKVKIYFPKQPTDIDTLEQELKSNAKKLAEAQTKQKQKIQELRGLRKKLRKMKKPRSIDSLDAKRNRLFNEISELKEQVKCQKEFEAKQKVSMVRVRYIQNIYANLVIIYKMRKRLCMDMIDKVYRNYVGTPLMLYKELNITSDQTAGFFLKEKIPRP